MDMMSAMDKKGFGELSDEIAKRIRLALAEGKIKPSSIYKGMGRTRAWWSQIMNGKRNISIKDLLDIASLLGVSPAALLPGGESAAPKPASIDDEIERKVLAILDSRKK